MTSRSTFSRFSHLIISETYSVTTSWTLVFLWCQKLAEIKCGLSIEAECIRRAQMFLCPISIRCTVIYNCTLLVLCAPKPSCVFCHMLTHKDHFVSCVQPPRDFRFCEEMVHKERLVNFQMNLFTIRSAVLKNDTQMVHFVWCALSPSEVMFSMIRHTKHIISDVRFSHKTHWTHFFVGWTNIKCSS